MRASLNHLTPPLPKKCHISERMKNDAFAMRVKPHGVDGEMKNGVDEHPRK